METNLIKPKRVRRTKEQMMAFRQAQTESSKLPKEAAFRDSQRFNEGDCIPSKDKVAHKPNLEALDYVFDVKTKALKDAPKQISGWVNVYKGGKDSYWLGSDIHYTIESAKKIGGSKVIKQIYITFEDVENIQSSLRADTEG